uniref:Uncharacterized protein n=1 Tax=Anguilla anguilla TaxID=7936 RepID=A0A0E9Q1Y9_ANGAN
MLRHFQLRKSIVYILQVERISSVIEF